MAYYELGTYSRKITTTSEAAQLWFDRGLVWTYAYNHEEAIACFEKALEADADCALAHWASPMPSAPTTTSPGKPSRRTRSPMP